MKISISGHYYESADNQVDADGYNENTTKKRESIDKDAKGELERINCTFKEVLTKLQAEQRFDKVVQKADGEYQQINESLLIQCEVLTDLIAEVGLNQSEANSQLQEIAGIKKQLMQMQSKLKNKTKLNPAKFQEKLSIIKQEQQQSDQIDLNLQMVDEQELNQFQERIEKLNKQVGMSLLKQNSTGDAFFFRGSEIFNGNEKVSERKEKSDYNLIGQLTYQIQENDPQNLIAHIQMLKIQAKLLNGDEETIQKLQKIQEQQDQLNKSEQHQVDLMTQFQSIQKKHEYSLNAIDEIPKIISRLLSLKQLHSQTIFLPQQLEQTSQQLDWMLQSLEQGSEILDILEKQII